jgi:hypothetical protein
MKNLNVNGKIKAVVVIAITASIFVSNILFSAEIGSINKGEAALTNNTTVLNSSILQNNLKIQEEARLSHILKREEIHKQRLALKR